MDETRKRLALYGDKPIGERGQAHDQTITRLQNMIQTAVAPKTAREGLAKLDEAFMADLNGSAAITQKLVADAQDAVQIILTRSVKGEEQGKQGQAGYKLVQRYMTADPLKEPSAHLQKLLKEPTRAVLKGLVDASKNFKELDDKIASHKDKDALQQYLTKLVQVAKNNVVQGPFLLNKDN